MFIVSFGASIYYRINTSGNLYPYFLSFQLLDEKKLQQVDNLFEDFKTPEQASKV